MGLIPGAAEPWEPRGPRAGAHGVTGGSGLCGVSGALSGAGAPALDLCAAGQRVWGGGTPRGAPEMKRQQREGTGSGAGAVLGCRACAVAGLHRCPCLGGFRLPPLSCFLAFVFFRTQSVSPPLPTRLWNMKLPLVTNSKADFFFFLSLLAV